MGQVATASANPRQASTACIRTEDYVGQRASAVAQNVRRAGLKPALERTFGWGAQQIGLVVAQEPAPGTEVARNSSVKLYVGAPGEGDLETSEAPAPAAEPSARRAGPGGEQAGPRRRKRGLGLHESADTSPPPSPLLPKPPRGDEPRTEELRAAGEPSPEQLAERAGELFAEHRPGRWRSRVSWPVSARGWRRSRLAKVAAGVVALWLAVALASAFSSHGRDRSAIGTVHQRTPSFASETEAPRASRAGEDKPSPALAKPTEPLRPPRDRLRRRSHALPRARLARRERERTAMPVARSMAAEPPSPRATAEAPPAPEQAGGPFSP